MLVGWLGFVVELLFIGGVLFGFVCGYDCLVGFVYCYYFACVGSHSFGVVN